MNVVMECLLTRRNARTLEKRLIGREELEQTVKATLHAPSGRGLQTWQFTVVRDTGKIQKLVNAIGEEFGRGSYDMCRLTVLVISSSERSSPFGKEGSTRAPENIFLAAHSSGIGSVWINQLQDIHDVPTIRVALNGLEIPADYVIYGMATLGYPAEALSKQVVEIGRVRLID